MLVDVLGVDNYLELDLDYILFLFPYMWKVKFYMETRFVHPQC
jgi:hypothetical protein